MPEFRYSLGSGFVLMLRKGLHYVQECPFTIKPDSIEIFKNSGKKQDLTSVDLLLFLCDGKI